MPSSKYLAMTDDFPKNIPVKSYQIYTNVTDKKYT